MFNETIKRKEDGSLHLINFRSLLDSMFLTVCTESAPKLIARDTDPFGFIAKHGLDSDKKWTLRGIELLPGGEFLPIMTLNTYASERPFQVRVHEHMTPFSDMGEKGYAVFYQHDYPEKIFTNPGDEVTMAVLLNLDAVDGINLVFRETDRYSEDDAEEMEIPLTEYIEAAYKNIQPEFESSQEPGAVHTNTIMVTNHYEPENVRENNTEALRMGFDLIHVDYPARGETEMIHTNMLLLRYRYILRTR